MFEQIYQRILRLVKFDFTVFTEIEHDENATTEAAVIVAAAALLGALGTFIGFLITGGGFVTALWRFLVQIVISVAVGWLLWSYITMLVGTKLFGGDATFWGMARMLGYASVPGVLRILALIPCLDQIAALVAAGLSLVLGFFAVRETLGLTTEKAILTILIGWVVMIVVNVIIL
jgi:hypothetical protein